jgi:hypothetical protein
MSNRTYETLYGVGLLDDLHNHFPAVLYDPDRFRSVRDVLHYIASRTRRRFDLYSFGLSAFEDSEENEASTSRGVPPAAQPTHQFYNRRSPSPRAASPASATPSAAVQPAMSPEPVVQMLGRPATVPSINRSLRYVVDLSEEDDIQDNAQGTILTPTMLNTLMAGLHPNPNPIHVANTLFSERTRDINALSALASLLLRGENAILPNLEPVIVRPTPEQIEQATVVASPETEQDCAVCQDTISNTQESRKILHCGHWFHKDCIDPWFQQNVQCPVCRYDIREHSEAQQSQQSAE